MAENASGAPSHEGVGSADLDVAGSAQTRLVRFTVSPSQTLARFALLHSRFFNSFGEVSESASSLWNLSLFSLFSGILLSLPFFCGKISCTPAREIPQRQPALNGLPRVAHGLAVFPVSDPQQLVGLWSGCRSSSHVVGL